METDHPPDNRKPAFALSPFAVGCAIILTLACLLLVAAPIIGRLYFLKTRAPAERAELERFRSTPVLFPVEWTTSRSLSPDLKASAGRMESEYKAIEGPLTGLLAQPGTSGGVSVGPSVEERLTTQAAIAKVAARALTATSETVHRTDYEMGAITNFFMVQQLAKAAVAQSAVAVTEQNWTAAFQSALLPMYSARRHPASSLFIHLIAVSIQSIAAKQLGQVARQCPDSIVLHQTLDELNRLYDVTVFGVLDRAEMLELFSRLLAYRSLDLSVSLDPGKPLIFYHKQVWRNSTRALEIELSKLPFASPMRQPLEQELANEKKMSRFLYIFVPEIRYSVERSNYMEAMTRERVATARMDLARLAIAQRIALLTSSAATSSPSTLAAAYMPSEPLDPCGGGSYLWNSDGQQFYSMGPDKTDDRLTIAYDPTNGTTSIGDVTLPTGP